MRLVYKWMIQLHQPQFSDYRVLFDRHADGFSASSVSGDYYDGELALTIMRASDAQRGLQQWLIKSPDMARTWSKPHPFGPPLENPELQFQSINFAGRTPAGTLLFTGFFLAKGIREFTGNYEADLHFRPSQVIMGRQAKGESQITWTRHPSGAFFAEQFASPGVIMRHGKHPGRIVLPIYGSLVEGENLRCGMLLSDDDGLSWQYRQVGFNPDPAIRYRPLEAAGYNEQTLVEMLDGSLVSIIRTWNHPGRTEAYFYRSISHDAGETWTQPVRTNLPGTGASANGIALSDGSILMAARVPEPADRKAAGIHHTHLQYHGLNIARSFDAGLSWQTQIIYQYDPSGGPFENYYNAMNGQFVELAPGRWIYVFGYFDHPNDRHLALGLTITG